MKIIYYLFFLTLLNSCNNQNEQSKKELELKEKELQLKEKEIALKESENTQRQNVSKSDINNIVKPVVTTNIENLIGNWFVPHDATTNIKFFREGRFEFNDYNSSLAKEELLLGSYKLENNTLTLLYDDRPKQKFKFSYENNSFIIKNASGYYFVKGENGN